MKGTAEGGHPTTTLMGLKLLTPPEALPVSLDELKLHVRVDTDDFDDDLTLKLEAAVRHVEEITRRALITQEWKLSLPRFPYGDRELVLPKGSLQAVSEITYLDAVGERVTLDEDDYVVSSATEPARIVPAFATFWPIARRMLDSVQITFTCGFGDGAADVPADLRHAILLFAGWAFQGVESDQSLGGTETSRSRAFKSLWQTWKLESDDVAELVSA